MIADSRARREKKVKQFKCQQCNYVSASTTLLMRHTKTDHEGTYPCEQCDYESASSTLLMQHTQSVHKVDHGSPYSCEQCEYESATPTLLKQHKQSVQNIDHGGPYPCEQCDYVSVSPTLLKEHTQSVHKKNCDRDDKQVVESASQTQHTESKRAYKSKRIKCDHCNKKFNKSEIFIKHLKEAHQEISTKLETKSKSIETTLQKMTFQRQLRSYKKSASATKFIIN